MKVKRKIHPNRNNLQNEILPHVAAMSNYVILCVVSIETKRVSTHRNIFRYPSNTKKKIIYKNFVLPRLGRCILILTL